ncbi:MAG TPA: putative quinol monooxygenase, partial [Vicinamibacterales bacterium]|nr:putative quinol monooxygenase [Vicinamibacterales bacterium]
YIFRQRHMKRREFLRIFAASPLISGVQPKLSEAGEEGAMYGLISKIKAAHGKGEELSAVLLAGNRDMPGCLSYVVARDTADADAIWVTEVWADQASHQASLQLPAVKDAIAKGRPLITGFGERSVTTPVGGVGLPRHR